MKLPHVLGISVAFGALALVVAGASASCSQTPTNVAIRTFEQAQNVDVVCINVNDTNGNALPVDQIEPLVQSKCAPVPTNAFGPSLPNHLYAVVTQLTRGELAVVDLTAGNVVDEDRATPGINFIPVGPNPTGVSVTPDGSFTFVSSGDVNKPAIYTIDNRRLLGDSTGTPDDAGVGPRPLLLTDLTACALPQPPVSVAVGTRTMPPAGASPFVVNALLRPSAGMPAKVVAIDPTPLTNGSSTPGTLPACSVLGAIELSGAVPDSFVPGPKWPDGVPYVEGGVDLSGQEPSLGPNCPSAAPPPSDAGAADAADAAPTDAGAPDAAPAVAGDAAVPLAVGPVDQPHPASMALRDDAHVLYIGDSSVPLIHVVDVSDPSSPKELPPLLATSITQPSRRVSVGPIAISPPTRDFTRYLYAVDAGQGTLMVFDITDPVTSPRTPLLRPHSELNPFADPDRIVFSAPVATVAFAQHDWPLPSQVEGSNPTHQFTGILCNPNPNALPTPGTFNDLGAYYRPDQATVIQSSGTPQGFPSRLRGVFAFATLANGNIVAVDVDDWDAPCRRPDPMAIGSLTDPTGVVIAGPTNGQTGVLAIPQPAAGSPDDLNPFHAPLVFNTAIGSAGVTEEVFFPVSAPNRLRSTSLLANDPISGQHSPNLLGLPLLFDVNGAPVATSGANAVTNPLILPTALAAGFVDYSYIQNPTAPNPATRIAVSPLASTASAAAGSSATPETAPNLLPGSSSTSPPAVRISFDDPTAHIDQDWTVTYEGALPTVSGIAANMTTPDHSFDSLTLSAPSASFCARGIEDMTIGAALALQVSSAEQAAHLPTSGVQVTGQPAPAPLTQWTSDYIEIADDLVPQGDLYWQEPTANQPDNCWEGPLKDDGMSVSASLANDRFNTCNGVFGPASEADTHLARDFPIVEAFDDKLVITRFAWDPTVTEQTTNRVVVPGPDPSNAPFLKLATCCFHGQATFKVRTGGEWVAVGANNIGLLHHVVTDPASRRCVLSCDPQFALLNARTFDIPWSSPSRMPACTPPGTGNAPPVDITQLGRDSLLAMRNPMFSYIVWTGCGVPPGAFDHTLTPRDFTWKFSMRGGFNPLTVSLTQGTNVFVSPQSMLYVSSLGQMAIVDGAQQGLVLIDLNTLAFAHAPFF